tara:strand:+ start:742 stop:936 length:195 start_codon:yes stop_codon:yes gene_type:complete
MSYCPEKYPPLSKEEFHFFSELIREFADLYQGNKYLSSYIAYEYVRHVMGKDPKVLDYFEENDF